MDFKGRTALITGAAHGFGVEFAKECARRGMKIALVDIDKPALDDTLKLIQGMGADAIAIQADVSLEDEVKKMVKTTLDKYGEIGFLVNNAGVYFMGNVWDVPTRDVRWMLDVNVVSMIAALKEVIPVMLKQGTECYILDVCSVAGIGVNRSLSAYHASKHAALALSEAAFLDLQATEGGEKIGMSVYCPGYIQTDLHHSENHRPDRFKAEDPYYKSETYAKNQNLCEKLITGGIPIDSVAEYVFSGIDNGQFYLIPDMGLENFIKIRHTNIEQKKNPDIENLF